MTDANYGDVRFKHIRRYDSNGLIHQGGLTLAYAIYVENDIPSVVFNYAKCHTDEAYCRKIGRDMAFARFQKNASSADITTKRRNIGPNKWHRYNIKAIIEEPINSASILFAIRDWFVEAMDNYDSFADNFGQRIYFTRGQMSEYKEVLDMIHNHILVRHITITAPSY